jgi:hypothetical protein
MNISVDMTEPASFSLETLIHFLRNCGAWDISGEFFRRFLYDSMFVSKPNHLNTHGNAADATIPKLQTFQFLAKYGRDEIRLCEMKGLIGKQKTYATKCWNLKFLWLSLASSGTINGRFVSLLSMCSQSLQSMVSIEIVNRFRCLLRIR